MRLTVAALATEAEAAESIEQQCAEIRAEQAEAEAAEAAENFHRIGRRRRRKAEAEAAKRATCAAAKEQLAGAAGVAIDGVPDVVFNSVYLPAGEHEGWLRFESAEKKHLFRCVRDSAWYLLDRFDPDSSAPKAYVKAKDGVLPVGEQQLWTCMDGGWREEAAIQLPLSVSLLAVGAEEVKQAERRLAEREADPLSFFEQQQEERIKRERERIKMIHEYHEEEAAQALQRFLPERERFLRDQEHWREQRWEQWIREREERIKEPLLKFDTEKDFSLSLRWPGFAFQQTGEHGPGYYRQGTGRFRG